MSTSNSFIDDLQLFIGGQNGSEKKLDEKISQMMGDAYLHALCKWSLWHGTLFCGLLIYRF